MRRGLALLALALVAGPACSSRERSNPFDPGNPRTQGRPIAFVALAGNGLVTLRWQAVTNPGLTGYQAFRRAADETTFQAITDVLPVSTDQFRDIPVLNGKELTYQLYYVFSGGRAGRPAEDQATPGPLVPWVTDLSSASLTRLTPDGRHRDSDVLGFDGPTQVAVDPSRGLVWTTDPFAGQVLIFNPFNQQRTWVSELLSPIAVAVDPSRHTAWVCDEGTNLVSHFTETGDNATPPFIGPFGLPIAVAVDPADGSVWVCERQTERVRRFSPDGALLASAPVTLPSRVAVDSSTGDAWITSFEGRSVVRVSSSGSILDTLEGFLGPIGVAVDPRRGQVWIADALAGQLVAVARDGTEQFRASGLSEAREVAVDLATGDAWVTVPGAGRVVRFSDTGVVLRTLVGFAEPYGIALDPGR